MENNNTTENKPKSIKKRRATKILLILYVVALVLHFIPALAAFADFDQSEVNGGAPLYFSKAECIEKLGESENYIFANLDHMKYSSSWGCNRHNAITFYYRLSDDVTYTEENGYYVVNITGSSMCYKSGEWHYDSDRDRVISDQWGTGSNNLWSSSSYSIKIKTDLSEIVWGSETITQNEFVSFEYKIGDLEEKYSSIKVSFNPALTGNVNREVSINGSTSMLSELKVSVQNNGSNSVQYSLAIYEKNGTTARNGSSNPDIYYGDDPVYVYYTNDWVYGEQINADSNGIYTNVPIEYQKPTEWHYLAGNTSDNFTIKFTQINLKQGLEYTVVVQAVDCPYDKASLIPSTADYLYAGIDFSAAETVYSSDFVMLQYDDVVYNPDDDSNGVLPYNGYEGNGQSNLYGSSYNAFGVDGNIFYEPHKGSTGSNFGSSFFPNNSGSQYNSVLSQSSSAFGFIGTVLSWFPSDIYTVVNVCLWLGVFIFIIKGLK